MSTLNDEAGVRPVEVGQVIVDQKDNGLLVQMGRREGYAKRFVLFSNEEPQLLRLLLLRAGLDEVLAKLDMLAAANKLSYQEQALELIQLLGGGE